MQSSLQEESTINIKNAIVNIILVVSTLVWYLCIFSFLKGNSGFTGKYLVLLFGINLLAVVFFAVLSTVLIQKIEKRLKFITYWMIAGIFVSSLALLVGGSSFFYVAIISGVVGAYFGFGFPVVLGYYSANIKSVYRARISGLTIFFNGVGFALTGVFISNSTVVYVASALILWKLCGLLVILLLKPSEVLVNKEETVSYKSILKMRSMLFYFLPWLMFSLVNNFAFPVLYSAFPVDLVNNMTTVEAVIAGVSAIFFGFFADRFGRKRLLFFGFVLLGLGYALLGLFPHYDRGLLFYTVADGVAWGIFFTLFLLTLWGDIADKRGSEKFFVIGFLPYLLSNFLQLLFGSYVATSVVELSAVFSFACFFLFIAAVPLYLAPETLSEKELRAIDLQDYLDKATAKAEKEAEKAHLKEKTD
ncbi:MAG: MFS transporter [Candidatus Bathyarchaeota archaeon]|nr:MFS transporter [Candidatus Termiticorpusculum sp.]